MVCRAAFSLSKPNSSMQCVYQAIKAETDGLREELEFVRTLGADLIFACGETEKPEVKKTIDEMNAAWEGLNRTWRERMERLEEAMTASVQYQDALQHKLEAALLALGQFQHALSELQAWLSHTHTTLDTQRPISSDPKAIEIELAKHHVRLESVLSLGLFFHVYRFCSVTCKSPLPHPGFT
ncbi:hypothetical protein XENOCAPTIV_026476 [Xenoophorus captivus]|uniref:Dystrophin n=1 Tax=Xenoophorus captivus TaxID=1517983 RepID=A0ABV0Q3I3_9TELE